MICYDHSFKACLNTSYCGSLLNWLRKCLFVYLPPTMNYPIDIEVSFLIIYIFIIIRMLTQKRYIYI